MQFPDQIDPSSIRVVNSFGNFPIWEHTVNILSVELRPGRGVVVNCSDTSNWPDYHLDNDPAAGLARYTLCAGFQINGQWVMSGFFEYWAHEGRIRTDSGAHPLEIAPDKGINQWQANWVYSNSWSPLSEHVPVPGEPMAIMLVAGDARMSKTRTKNERSQIVTVPLQLDGIWTFGIEDPIPVPEPVPEPVPVPLPPVPEPVPVPAPVPIPVPVPAPLPTPPALPPVTQLAQILFSILTALGKLNARLDHIATHEDVVVLQQELEKQGTAIVTALNHGGSSIDLSSLLNIFGKK